MLDIRWFAPNRYCTLPVPRLQEAGLRITTHGDASARLVIAADGACAVEAYRFAWRHRCPMVVYLWDLPPWQLDGGRPNLVLPFRGRVVKVPRPWGGYPGRTGYFSRLRYIARNALEVWAPSWNTRDDVGRRFGVEAQHVPFCFDTDRFNRAAGWHKPTAGRPVVLSISRLERHKNQAAVIRAVASLSPQPLMRIVGKGPEAAHLQSLASQLGIDLQLDEGWLTDEQIVEAYRTASVLVCPSRFEGLGVTPLQGVAIGMPTVASDIPTHREFVVGQAALVPLDDDAAMAAAIDVALRSEGTVQPGPTHPVPELTIEACAARFLPRLEELLRGAG